MFSILLKFSLITSCFADFLDVGKIIQSDFSLLINFTCATAKDELEKHPEMRTIAMIELENNFPSDFSVKVLKCLPPDVAKFIFYPHSRLYRNNTLRPIKQMMVIYIADNVEWPEIILDFETLRCKSIPVTHHLSKYIIVSSDRTKIKTKIFSKLLRIVQIYEQNQKLFVRSFNGIKEFKTFEHQNLFPNRMKNIAGSTLYAAFTKTNFAYLKRGILNCKWKPYLDIIAEKMNATLEIIQFKKFKSSLEEYEILRAQAIQKFIQKGKFDFYLNFEHGLFDLESYNQEDWCFVVPLPEPFSIVELILFLPLDKSCWMWLGITIAVSTLLWRISEGHWNFAFGAFSSFVGQSAEINTSRFVLKILLQIWILTFFIFSNGYQSIVTSFMLDPIEQPLLSSVDEVLESDLKIVKSWILENHWNNPKFQDALKTGRIIDFEGSISRKKWPVEIIKNKLATLQPCKIMKVRIEDHGDGKGWKNLYMISEVVASLSRDLYTRPFHPYLEIFQEIMDRTFEAGLHQTWEKYYYDTFSRLYEREERCEDKTILDFEAIAPFFFILFGGFVIGLLTLWCEIFYRDFLSQLSREFFKRMFKKLRIHSGKGE